MAGHFEFIIVIMLVMGYVQPMKIRKYSQRRAEVKPVENRFSNHTFSWIRNLGDMMIHESATVNVLLQTVVMASSDRSLLQRHVRPALTFHDFKTGLVAIKIRNKFKGHHKRFGGSHVRRAQSTCYIVPVRTDFKETVKEIVSRNRKTVTVSSSPRHFVTSASTVADYERAAFNRRSHFLSRACRMSAIINSQSMPSEHKLRIKNKVTVMSVWGAIVIRQTFDNHHARIYKEFTNGISNVPHAWRFNKYHG